MKGSELPPVKESLPFTSESDEPLSHKSQPTAKVALDVKTEDKPKETKAPILATPTKPQKVNVPEVSVGMIAMHKKFGKGTISNIDKAGKHLILGLHSLRVAKRRLSTLTHLCKDSSLLKRENNDMGKPRKDGQRFNMIMDRNLYNRLSFYADEKGQTMTLAIERLLKQSLDDAGVPEDVPNKEK